MAFRPTGNLRFARPKTPTPSSARMQVNMTPPGGVSARLAMSLLSSAGVVGSLAGEAGSSLTISNGVLMVFQTNDTLFAGNIFGPGVLAKTAAIFGRHDISISSVLQHEAPPGSRRGTMVPVVVTTASALEGNLRRALAEVDALKVIRPPSVSIAMVEEHPEEL